ncbi:MAG: TonB-dependent receptor [Halioglobus sp.]
MTSKFAKRTLALAVILSASSAQIANAQLMLEEVIVTAQKKAQSLADAPLTVNVVSGEQIQDFDMFQADELSKLTAGVEIRNEGDSNTGVAMRGVGTLTQQAAPPRVGVYLDDWNAGGASSNFVFKQMFDIAQVQMLRGPQGTLYGQPSPTGALLLATADPNPSEVEGFITGSFQDPNGYNVQGAISMPLIEDELAIRVAVLLDERETGVENITRNIDNEINSEGYRAKLLWEPNDVFTAKLGWTHVESDDLETYRAVESITPTAAFQLDAKDRTSLQDAPDQVNSAEDDLYTLHLGWDTGPIELTLFMARHEYTTDYASDDDLTEQPMQTVAVDIESKDGDQFELRGIASPFDWWDTQFGYYYSNVSSQTDVSVFNNVPPSLVANIGLDIPVSEKTQAVFSHNDFFLTDMTTLTVGLRYNEFDNSSSNNSTIDLLLGSTMEPGGGVTPPVATTTVGCPDGSAAPCALASGEKEEKWTGTVKIAHAFNDDHNIYATYDRGYRPGAPNFDIEGSVPPEMLAYGGESVNSVEIGLKGTFWEGRAQYGAATYYSVYDDYQVNPSFQIWNPTRGAVSDIDIVYVNVEEAEQYGIEGELRVLLSQNWTLFSSLAWSQVEFTKGEVPCTDSSQPPVSPENPINVCDASGGVAGEQPDWSFVLQSEYSQPLNAISSEWFVSGLFNYRGEAEVPGDSEGRLTADSYSVLDLFGGVRNDIWSAKVYVKNVFDEDAVIARRAAGENYNDISLIQPRTAGITLSYRY